MPEPNSSFRDERVHKKTAKDKTDGRTPAQRDRDRLLYSSAFRRLAEVTQVVAANSGYVFHNRLTHSLQVAQVGRRLAEKLNRESCDRPEGFEGLDPDVVEAASLAHDLGHPPFGHVIEETLNSLAKDIGGFEGNAQSFRIISKLAFHSPKYPGLDLTRATLCAVLKYPWLKDENPKKPNKWGAYSSESDELQFARELYPNGFEQCTEAFLMDIADDITYCVHDLEDFYRAGRIPLHLLAAEGSREVDYFFEDMVERLKSNGDESIDSRKDMLKLLFRELLFTTFPATQPYRGSQSQRAGLRNFTGTLIARYINGVSLTMQGGRLRPCLKTEYKDEILLLKQLTWTYVIQEPALATQQLGQEHMIKTLFCEYRTAAMKPSGWRLFPTYYRERLQEANSEAEKVRTCVDLIAGMTEVQVQRLYSRITGQSGDSSLSDPLS
jgi:dGTPase